MYKRTLQPHLFTRIPDFTRDGSNNSSKNSSNSVVNRKSSCAFNSWGMFDWSTSSQSGVNAWMILLLRVHKSPGQSCRAVTWAVFRDNSYKFAIMKASLQSCFVSHSFCKSEQNPLIPLRQPGGAGCSPAGSQHIGNTVGFFLQQDSRDLWVFSLTFLFTQWEEAAFHRSFFPHSYSITYSPTDNPSSSS